MGGCRLGEVMDEGGRLQAGRGSEEAVAVRGDVEELKQSKNSERNRHALMQAARNEE